MVNVNDFKGKTDSEILENAIANRTADGIVVISPRNSDTEPERDYWLIDRAILIPENTTVILQNCTIKLSDKSRDNFFRTANCGFGIEYPEKIKNVHLVGEGLCTLLGADHPRSTGDGGKILANPCPYFPEDLIRLADWVPEEHKKSSEFDFWDIHAHTYGTDAGKDGESQYGDWRNIGVLFANVENFSIKNIKIVEPHGWSISLEACSYGKVENIEFCACMSKEIDGIRHNMENQDGLDLRNGCHHITISDIKGKTGDDVVALTAIASNNFKVGGSLRTTSVMHNDWSKRESGIHDVIIKNVIGESQLCLLVRLLACNTKIQNIVIDGIVDTSEQGNYAGIGIGEGDGAYGKCLPDGVTNISISNVICNSRAAIYVGGYLKDSVITNIVNRKEDGKIFQIERENGTSNVSVNTTVTV